MIRRTLLAVVIVLLVCCSSAGASEERTISLVSVDPPGTSTSLSVLGPNVYYIVPKIAVTPDGKTAAYRTGAGGLYKSSDGHTELVGVGPNGVASGSGCGGEHEDCQHVISPDGERVVFETRTSLVSEDADRCPVGPGCVDIYDRVGTVTRLLSTGDPAGGNGTFEATIASLSPDGSRLFYNLDAASFGYGFKPSGVWERAEGPPSPFPSAEHQLNWADSLLNPEFGSSDGSRIFFNTYESLLPEDTDTCPGGGYVSGCSDFYERTSEGALRLVSTVPGDAGAYLLWVSKDGNRLLYSFQGALYERTGDTTEQLLPSSYGASVLAVSEDGRRIFFKTSEPLLSEDTDSAIDVYELSDRELTLVSTGRAGGSSSFDVNFSGISKAGSHVFFETKERLVAEDTDSCVNDYGRLPPGCMDLYEHTLGVTRLVSTGPASPNGDYRAQFNGASEDGQRVFFTTKEPLVSEDHDCVYPYYPDCPDIYERSHGVTTLISRDTVDCNTFDSGYPPYCPAFVAASRDGRRVLFVTAESLVPGDRDGFNDLYVSSVVPHACRPDKPGHRPKKCAA